MYQAIVSDMYQHLLLMRLQPAVLAIFATVKYLKFEDLSL